MGMLKPGAGGIDALKRRTQQIGAFEDGVAARCCSLEVGVEEFGTAEYGVIDVRANKVSATERCRCQVDTAEVKTAVLGPAHFRDCPLDAVNPGW